MKLYSYRHAVSPRRVALYLAEKGLTLETVEIDVPGGESRAPAFLAKNPRGLVPLLELDDGQILSESDAIIEYLEELHPSPPLLGSDAWQRARTREAERVVEHGLLLPIYTIFHHTHESWATRHKQAPEIAESQRQRFGETLAVIDLWLGARRFVAGDALTLADLTLLLAADLGGFVGCVVDGERHPHVTRWLTAMRARSGVNRGWPG